MKIVYISSSTIPSRTANSIHVMKMCQAFSCNGHNVTLIAPDKKEGVELGVIDIFDYYGVEQNFLVQKVSWLDMKGRSFIYGWLAAKASLKNNPDLIFCRNLFGCYFSALLGRNTVFESHSPIVHSGTLSAWVFKRLIKRRELKKIVVITFALKAYYEKHYPRLRGRIQVAPDAADPVEGGLTSIELADKGNQLQVGYVGHLYAGKGMEIISELSKLCDWADFHVVGGVEEDFLYWKQRCSGIKNLKFYGHVPHREAQGYIKSFDVVLLPNQRKVKAHGKGDADIGAWTSPLKVFEYMASRTPIVASDIPVLREVLRDNHNCLLCNPDDVAEWKHALIKIRDNADLASSLKEVAYHEFRERYTWEARSRMVLSDLVDDFSMNVSEK